MRWTSSETTERIVVYLERLCRLFSLQTPESWFSPEGHQVTVRLALELRREVERLDRERVWAASSHARQRRATLHVLGESSLRLCEVMRWPAEKRLVSSTFSELCAQRPVALLEYDQLFCSPDSTERRAFRMLQDLPQGGRVLALGDDDLTSLALSQHYDGEIDVVELDVRLLAYIQERAPQVRCLPMDLFDGGLPPSFVESYDAVVLDPPWDVYHAWCFLHKAVLAMKQTAEARLFLSFCPLNVMWLERRAARFWRKFRQVGLVVESIEPSLQLYPLEGTEFMELLLSFCPHAQEPLLEVMRGLPFGFSELYVLRRDEGAHRSWWRERWNRWSHIAAVDSPMPAFLERVPSNGEEHHEP